VENAAALAGVEAGRKQRAVNICASTDLRVEEGQHVCGSCSSILGRVIDMGAEWRFYGAEDSRDSDPTRCGMPTNNLMPKSSLGSVVGMQRGEQSGYAYR